ncbi:MAG: dihydrofolate reductase family protein [Candidatus Levyibacteriota bacterium]
MRKIVMFNLISLDGFFAGKDGNIDWHQVDEEFNHFAVEQTKTFGAIIFGRTTYQMFESFWPKAAMDTKMSPEDREIGHIIDTIDKVVYSTTLEKATWQNTKLFREINAEEVKKLKEEPGGDMVIFGSGSVVHKMTELRLIDEYRVLVNPVILGEGKSMFGPLREQLKLKLLDSRTFGNGNVLLTYRPLH